MTEQSVLKKKRKHTNDLRRGKRLSNELRFAKEANYLFVRCNAKYVRMNFDEVICIRGKRGYILIATEKESYITLNKLNEIIEYLPENLFCRVHHSFIVAVNRIKAFDNEKVYLYGEPEGEKFKPGLACVKELPVGAFYRKNIKKSVRFMPSYTGRRSNAVKEAEMILEYGLEEND